MPGTPNTSGGSSSSDPLSSLLALGGGAAGIIDHGNEYSGLQSALKTIGPTSLQGWGLNGPGGMSTSFNPTNDTANINLGNLNPAYSGFASAAAGGSNAYSPQLLQALTSGAMPFAGLAGNTLGGAYGNYNAGMGAAASMLGNLGNFNSTYGNLLGAMRGQMAPGVQQSAYGLQNTLFGNGVADSTGAASGSLAEQNFGRGVAQADSSAQLNAFQQALAQQNSAAQNYGTLSANAGNILSNAFSNFGNTNQLISGMNTAQLNNAGTAAQGAGALNTVGLNNYNATLQTGGLQGQTRNQSLFPYASVATALSHTPTALGSLGSFLSQAGANGGTSSGLAGLLSKIPGLSSLFGGGNAGANQVNNFFAQNPGLTQDFTSGLPNSYSSGNFDTSGFNLNMSQPGAFNIGQYGSPSTDSSF